MFKKFLMIHIFSLVLCGCSQEVSDPISSNKTQPFVRVHGENLSQIFVDDIQKVVFRYDALKRIELIEINQIGQAFLIWNDRELTKINYAGKKTKTYLKSILPSAIQYMKNSNLVLTPNVEHQLKSIMVNKD